MTESEIEKQMDKALEKIPYEIKKIKIILWIVKKIKGILKF